MVLKRLEIAYPGQHGSEKTELSEEMIVDVLRNHKGVAPVTISHEAATEEKVPAVGKVIYLDRPRKKLEAVVEISDELNKSIVGGEINNWSPGFREGSDGWYLHHLAFSGSVPGKMKDLKILSEMDAPSKIFGDGKNSKVITFTDSGLKIIEPKEKIMEELKKLIEALQAKIDKLEKAVEETKTQSEKKEKTEEKTEESTVKFADENKKLKAEISKMQKETFLKELEGKVPKARLDEVKEFLDGEEKAGRNFADNESVTQFVKKIVDAVPAATLENEVVFSDGNAAKGEIIDFGSLAQKL